MTQLVQTLYLICNLMLVPVIAALLVLLALTLIATGGFLRECLSRRRTRREMELCLTAAKAESPELRRHLESATSGLLGILREDLDGRTEDVHNISHAVAQIENRIAAQTARLSLLTRLGPMLGLMGTLIPLGPALTGLSTGDLNSLAQNLIAAFATTVVGIMVGAVSYSISLIRKSWYLRDLTDIEFILAKLQKDVPHV